MNAQGKGGDEANQSQCEGNAIQGEGRGDILTRGVGAKLVEEYEECAAKPGSLASAVELSLIHI
eukprot:3218697-Alexandrium_andersonii.AAC.1